MKISEIYCTHHPKTNLVMVMACDNSLRLAEIIIDADNSRVLTQVEL